MRKHYYKQKKGRKLDNGRAETDFCNGDYQRNNEAAEPLAVGCGNQRCIECHSGSGIDFQVTEIREWAAAYMPAALSRIIEGRCLLWRKSERTVRVEY